MFRTLVVHLLIIFFAGKSGSAKAQKIVPTCEPYKNLNAINHKIKTIEVYDSKRNLKVAYYKFDREGYLLRFDTLVHFHDTFPSQKKYVQYLNNRGLIIDSTVNLSFNYEHVPPRSVQNSTLQCLAGKKEIKILQYNLGSRKDSILRLYHFSPAGNIDTIYRIDVYAQDAGRKQVESYFDYRPGTTPLVFDRKFRHVAWVRPDYQGGWRDNLYYDNLNRIICVKREARKVTYTYDADNLLIEEFLDWCDQSGSFPDGYDCGTTYYFKGKAYYSQRTLYFYVKNKLVKSIDYACNKTIENSGTIQYETLGAIGEITYEYNSDGLLRVINKPEATLVFKYNFYK